LLLVELAIDDLDLLIEMLKLGVLPPPAPRLSA
jgi:hypothetical protein